MAKRKLQAADLNGISIYHDPKYGTVYYDIFTKRAFQIINSDVQTYMVYSMMTSLSILIGYVAYALFKVQFAYAFLIGIIFYLCTKIAYRFLFIYKLHEIKGWKKSEKDNILQFFAKRYSFPLLVALFVLLVALCITLWYFSIMENMTGINLIASHIVSIGSLIFALFIIVAMIYKKKNNL